MGKTWGIAGGAGVPSAPQQGGGRAAAGRGHARIGFPLAAGARTAIWPRKYRDRRAPWPVRL